MLTLAELDSAAGGSALARDMGEPIPICKPRLSVLPLTVAHMPAQFKAIALATARSMNVPFEFVAGPLISVVMGVLGTRVQIAPKKFGSWRESCVSFTLLISDSGTLKTPCINAALSNLSVLEKEELERFESSHRKWKILNEAEKFKEEDLQKRLRQAVINSEVAEETRIKREMEALEKTVEPVKRLYRIESCTRQKFVAESANNPAITLVSDEVVGLIEQWSAPGREGDRQFWLTAMTGTSPYSEGTLSRGRVTTPCLGVNILGATQPDRLESHLIGNARKGGDDGLIQRASIALYPDPVPYEMHDEPIADGLVSDARHLIQTLGRMDFLSAGASRDREEEIPYFRFCQQAQERYYEFHESNSAKIKDEKTDGLIRSHIAKYPGFVAKLALAFHLIDVAASEIGAPVSLQALELAISWVEVLETHARRMYGQSPDHQTMAIHALSQRVADGSLTDGMTARDVVRKGWSWLKTPEQVTEAANKLAEKNWLAIIESGTAKGQKRTQRYYCNPRARGVPG